MSYYNQRSELEQSQEKQNQIDSLSLFIAIQENAQASIEQAAATLEQLHQVQTDYLKENLDESLAQLNVLLPAMKEIKSYFESYTRTFQRDVKTQTTQTLQEFSTGHSKYVQKSKEDFETLRQDSLAVIRECNALLETLNDNRSKIENSLQTNQNLFEQLNRKTADAMHGHFKQMQIHLDKSIEDSAKNISSRINRYTFGAYFKGSLAAAFFATLLAAGAALAVLHWVFKVF